MRKTFTLFCLLIAATVGSAQQLWTGKAVGESHENGIDLRTPGKWVESEGARALTSTNRAQGDVKVRWIDRINNMPEHLLAFYQDYGNLVKSALTGQQNCLTDVTLGYYDMISNSYCIVIKNYKETASFSCPKDASETVVREKAALTAKEETGKVWQNTDRFMPYVSVSLTYDFPEGFWLDSYYRWGYIYQYSYSYTPSSGQGTVTYEMVTQFKLKTSSFNHLREEFHDKTVLASAIGEYNTRVAELTTATRNSGSRYNQMRYLNNWLTKHNNYNTRYGKTDQVAKIAWSPMSALRGSTGEKGPVCEGYARAFKVVCDQLGIPCVLAVGFARSSVSGNGESHMWNEVEMDDGKWYAVDVTWNDPTDSWNRADSGYEHERWLLLGSDDIVAPNLTFAASHPFSPTWGFEIDHSQYWDYQIGSFITNHKYDATNDIKTVTTADAERSAIIYGINGQRLGCGTADLGKLKGKTVIIDNKKVVVR